MRLKGIRDSTFDFLLLIDNGVFSGVKMELVDFLSGNVSMEIECEGNVKIKVLAPVTPVVKIEPGGGVRTTTVHCPIHGVKSYKEYYDCESGVWELQG